MRSEAYRASPHATSFIDVLVHAVCDIANVFLLLGDLIAARTHTVKKSDRSEPPDVLAAMQAA